MSKTRVIAIHLPQFHPVPENNKWWGEGFTEWTNVTKARPLFKGHDQPHLPADLGFYDLRLAETRSQQAALARKNGVHGFCYYHYWFSGKRLLNAPIDQILASNEPDLPFMLFWANETWSRRWLGEEKEVLIKQEYSNEDDRNHATWLCEHAFSDKRYITINSRPVFSIYRPHDLPDYKKTIETIKETSIKLGIKEPYIIGSNSHTQNLEGFDNVISFEPQLTLFPDAFKDGFNLKRLLRNLKHGVFSGSAKLYDYNAVKKIMADRSFSYDYLPCVFVGWDNTARRGINGVVVINQNEDAFKQSLSAAKQLVSGNEDDEKIVFINAWNEWAEGNYLEPSRQFGHTFLNAVKDVFAGD